VIKAQTSSHTSKTSSPFICTSKNAAYKHNPVCRWSF